MGILKGTGKGSIVIHKEAWSKEADSLDRLLKEKLEQLYRGQITPMEYASFVMRVQGGNEKFLGKNEHAVLVFTQEWLATHKSILEEVRKKAATLRNVLRSLYTEFGVYDTSDMQEHFNDLYHEDLKEKGFERDVVFPTYSHLASFEMSLRNIFSPGRVAPFLAPGYITEFNLALQKGADEVVTLQQLEGIDFALEGMIQTAESYREMLQEEV